jgi:hypothetical protein
MNLLQMRTEVLAHGFDPIAFSSRINAYLNDAQSLVARRVDYYIDETQFDFSPVVGTAKYALPTNFGRVRSLRDTSRQMEMQAVGLRQIDRSSLANGAPMYYALDGANMHLYPTPDNLTYTMELRYWMLPVALVNDTDTPTLPADWHHLLWPYAVSLCYESEDDAQMGQYWMKRFTDELAMFAADQKFPSTDSPSQVAGMWDGQDSLSPAGWTLWGGT